MSSLISEWAHAILRWVSPNEVGLDQKFDVAAGEPTWDDPVKLRLGAFRPYGREHFYFGAIGMDLLSPPTPGNPRPHEEKGFIAFKVDSNDGEEARPCVEFHLQRTAHTHDDEDMLCVARISSKGIELDPKSQGGMGVFYQGRQLGGAASGHVSQFYTDDGKYKYTLQSDPVPGLPFGRIVVYETDAPFGHGVRPVGELTPRVY